MEKYFKTNRKVYINSKEIVHLVKETELIEKQENTTRYIEKYYTLNNELLFIKEIVIPNNPVFATNSVKFDKDEVTIKNSKLIL